MTIHLPEPDRGKYAQWTEDERKVAAIRRARETPYPYSGVCACGQVTSDICSHRAPKVMPVKCSECGARVWISRFGV